MESPGLRSPEYSGTKLLTFTAVFIPTQIIAVALRYLARYIIDGPWGLDDIVVLTSLALQMCMAGLSIGSVYNAGVGYHVPYLEATNPQLLPLWGKYLVAISILYFGSVNIPKIAILALYHRLFPNKPIRLAVWAVVATLVSLTISTVATGLASCRPFAANWDPHLPGASCINKEAFFRYGSIPNILTDIVMLILPMRVVWHLHTSVRLKIGLFATFAVGSFGLVTSIVRFATFFRKDSFVDGTWSAVDLVIWTQVETGVYLISACLMTYRPLLERVGKGGFVGKLTHRTRESKGNSENTIPLKPRSEDDKYGFRRLEDDNRVDPRITVRTDITVNQKAGGAGQDLESAGHI